MIVDRYLSCLALGLPFPSASSRLRLSPEPLCHCPLSASCLLPPLLLATRYTRLYCELSTRLSMRSVIGRCPIQ